jgi:hypothetical protein
MRRTAAETSNAPAPSIRSLIRSSQLLGDAMVMAAA